MFAFRGVSDYAYSYMSLPKKYTTQKAFTLVELAVAIVLIGIVASLGYFGFSTWRDRVAEAELKSDLTSVASAMESARN